MANSNFLSELKRRNVYRVGAAYVVAAFVLIEVVSNVAPVFNFPGWIAQAVILLLVVGFPAVLCLAWVYEITPDGVKRTAEVEQDASVTHQTGHRLNIVIIGLFVVLAGLYGVERFLPQDEGAENAASTSAQAPPNTTAVAGSISIAVLPFVNLSSDPEQEFFSDGMTEEITSALAKVKGLQVVGRTSAFEFKGQNKDLNAIGKALRASHLLEGSVRKSGNRVRITGQLIRADSGTHVWTENYDRDLTDLFAIQDDIAQTIARALQVPLGLKTGETLVASQAIAPESYQQYLQAKALWRVGSHASAVSLLEQVVARDPNYAPAWAMLASLYFQGPQGTPAYNHGTVNEARLMVDAWMPKAEMAALRAIQLDATLADGHVGLGVLQVSRGNFLLGEASLAKALALDPNNADGLYYYSNMLARVGKVKEALAMKLKLQALEPLVPLFIDTAAVVLWLNGQTDAAIAMMKEIPPARWANGPADIYASLGRYTDAANALWEEWESSPEDRRPPRDIVEEAMRLLRMAPARPSSPQTLPSLGGLNFVYLYVGLPERTLEIYERNVELKYSSILGGSTFWHPSYAAVRKTERFKAYIRNAGLVDYWRARGWPDLCRPVGADDFACD